MFWGIVIKPGASHTLTEGSELIHVSQACLADAKEGKCQLQVTDNNVTYTIAVLEKDKAEMASLDLFFNTVTPPTFINKGKSEIHLSGYFEMSDEPESEEDFDDEEIESEIEEEEEIENAAAAKAAIAGLSKKRAAAAEIEEESEDDEEGLIEGSEDEEMEDEEEDDEEEDDEEEDDDEEDEEEDEDDEEEDDEEDDEEEDDEEEDDEEEDEEEEEEEEEEQPKGKRPAPAQPKNQPAPKTPKTDNGPEVFAKSVVAFLKTKGGKSNISNIGGSVKRPAEVPKLKQFLAARKEFKLNGDNVELA